jgi:hypothetical protein
MCLSTYTFIGVYRFKGYNGSHSNDQRRKDMWRKQVRKSPTQLTDLIGQVQKKHQINRRSSAAEGKGSGLTDSFGKSTNATTESVGGHGKLKKKSIVWPIHSVITAKTTIKPIGGPERKRTALEWPINSVMSIGASPNQSVRLFGARELVAQWLPCTAWAINSVSALWGDLLNRSNDRFCQGRFAARWSKG